MNQPKKRGFAAMSPELARSIQKKGGQTSPSNFKNNRELARSAGAKGGSISRRKG